MYSPNPRDQRGFTLCRVLKPENRSVLSLTVVGLVFIGLVLGCAPPNDRSSQSNSEPRNAQSADDNKSNSWNYSESADEMGRGQIFRASIQSSNTISLDFPYQGEQHATMSIRHHPKHGKDVYITIEKGQLLESDYHGKVSVRFDDDKARTFGSSRPDDLSSETLFLRGAFPIFVSRL